MATSLPPLHTPQIPSLPPADHHPSFLRKDLSQQTTSSPSYSDKTPRRTSNRYSWSSSVSNPPHTPPTSSDNTATTPRKFRLPVRVSTDLTSFASSDSSPESRRRSLSLASDSKRRSRTISLEQQQQVEDKVADTKKSPSKDSPPSPPPPPPAYEKTPVSPETKKETPPAEPKADAQPAPPPYEKPTSPKKPEPRKEPEPRQQETAAPRQVPTTTTTPQKMSSSSSPDAQKGSMTANAPQGNRGLDFSMGNGNNKVTAQSGSLPLPGLSGRPNGPVGNLLRGPVDDEGNLKAAALTVGIKLDLEAEVHLSARVRGDILVGLY